MTEQQIFDDLQQRGYIDQQHKYGIGYWADWDGQSEIDRSGECVLLNGDCNDVLDFMDFLKYEVDIDDMIKCTLEVLGELHNINRMLDKEINERS